MSVCRACDSTATPVIQLSHISFAFEDMTQKNNSLHMRPYALRDVSVDINEGDFVGIIGPSGAGKTTLTSVLSGAIPHHFKGEFRGACLVAGIDTCEVELTDVSQIVGSVLQDIDAQMVSANVEDELLYGLENFGVDHEQIMPRVFGALEAVGIPDLLYRDIATLSGGQKQKVAIAAILALQPRVLVLDEPTAALDPLSSRQVFDTLRLLNQTQGITVVVVEQKVALLAEYCQRMLVLSEGTVALDGSPAEVLTHRQELKAIGVDSPRVTRVSNKLHAKQLLDKSCSFLTTDTAFIGIKNLIAGNKTPRTADFEPRRSEDAFVMQPEPSTTVMQQPILSFNHVGFSYGPHAASVQDINFEVYPGELLAIIGQNGAGKTTLTKLMNGLLKPSEGKVNICGLDTTVARTSQIARHVSTLFQDPDHQICKETVLDEVAFSLELLGVDTQIARARATQTIKQFSLPADVAPFSLSRGQRQIVALASVVVVRPKLLILDEPTCGLDYQECMVVMRAVKEARKQGCAIVMVCHDMEVVYDFASRIMVMSDGFSRADGNPVELFENSALMEQASVAPPQILGLSNKLVADGYSAYKSLSEVSDIVTITEGLVR